jgi:hypothetical protein
VSEAPEPSARVREEWSRRVEVEYRSAALTGHLSLWLIQAGVSPDLIRLALQIVDDELAHAELAHEVATAAGGVPRTVDRNALALVRSDDEPLEHDLVRACVGTFCLGETVAVPLFAALRADCTVAVARQALDRVLRDEVHHRDFGWSLLEWLLTTAPSLRALVERELPAQLAELRAIYAPTDAPSTPCSPGERAWGLMSLPHYGEILVAILDRDFIPRFAKLGLDARAAWSAPHGA